MCWKFGIVWLNIQRILLLYTIGGWKCGTLMLTVSEYSEMKEMKFRRKYMTKIGNIKLADSLRIFHFHSCINTDYENLNLNTH